MNGIWHKVKSSTKTGLSLVGAVTLVSYTPILYDFYILRKSQQGLKPNTKRVLVIPFDRLKFVEEPVNNGFIQTYSNARTGSNMNIKIQMRDFVSLLKAAKNDPNIVAIYGKGDVVNVNGYAQLEEIRNAIFSFRRSTKNSKKKDAKKAKDLKEEEENDGEESKPCFFFSNSFEALNSLQMSYYLASSFTRIIFQNRGNVNILGITSSHFFVKPALSKYGIKVNVFKQGKYKNAGDVLCESEMSPDYYENVYSVNTSLQNIILKNINASRSWNTNFNSSLWDSLMKYGTMTALNAKEVGLIDDLEWIQPIDGLVKKMDAGGVISIQDYESETKSKQYANNVLKKLKLLINDQVINEKQEEVIAILPIIGNITSRLADNILEQLQKIKKDKNVKCVVLRVDSKGGSAAASEVILAELNDLSQPVICSMSNYAASGGYYIASNCKHIFAQPTTITGSIGVIFPKFDVTEFASRHGITHTAISTSIENPSSALNPFESLNPQTTKIIWRNLNHVYDMFKLVVAQGRGKNLEDVEALAQGRVYTGQQAKEIGLIDTFGGITEAINHAQSQFTQKGHAKVIVYTEQQSFLQRLFLMFQNINNSIKKSLLEQEIQQMSNLLQNQDLNYNRVSLTMDDVTAVQIMLQQDV